MHSIAGKGGWRRLISLSALLWGLGVAAEAGIVCEVVDGPPGEEVVLWMEILSPEDGAVFQVQDSCGMTARIEGSYLVEAPQSSNDYYVTLDTSGSTTTCSEVDVDQDGTTCSATVGDPKDSIYHAELAAAEEFVGQLDGSTSSAALITFDTTPILHEPLTSDLNQVLATIDALKSGSGLGATEYVPALQMLEDEALARGDFANRGQWGLFLSDGEPLDDGTPVLDKAQELADLGIRVDTFDLDPDDAALEMLPEIASITGGVFHNLEKPGDIISLLPGLAFSYRFTVRNEATGIEQFVFQDFSTGTFDAEVELAIGQNRIVFVMETLDVDPLVLECPIEVSLEVPWPQDPGAVLKARGRGVDGNTFELDWSGAPDLEPYEHYRIFEAVDPEGTFNEMIRVSRKELIVPFLQGAGFPLRFYEVRTASCEDQTSYDPFPADSHVFPYCWVPADLSLWYPYASNLTDPACTNDSTTHDCDPSIELAGRDREFYWDLKGVGVLEASLSSPDLYVILYDKTGKCMSMGQGTAAAEVSVPGTYSIVVDAPAGGESDFDIHLDLQF